jgi:hypothetical protein
MTTLRTIALASLLSSLLLAATQARAASPETSLLAPPATALVADARGLLPQTAGEATEALLDGGDALSASWYLRAPSTRVSGSPAARIRPAVHPGLRLHAFYSVYLI